LEDLYNGTSKKLSLSRNVLCSKCKGKGSKSGASMTCGGCQGSGMKVSIRHLGPSMIQQMQHPCNECKGTGCWYDRNRNTSSFLFFYPLPQEVPSSICSPVCRLTGPFQPGILSKHLLSTRSLPAPVRLLL
ncbi:hypothetical protein FTX61_26050, partial [Nitriliruptoraceae bacterium ZYF776]|nr:hypothetical protein [Profundirhabdus halotolerans]